MTHTPTPWSYVRNPENTRYIIDDPQGRAIACTAGYEPDNEANARFIVQAVNSHHDLIEALTDVGASLAAAISLLERGGKAAKKAAPSDRMFDQMVKDYKASLERTRAILTKEARHG